MFLDDRLSGLCGLCGAEAATRDHVPAKVFLDDPLPPDLPVVAMCRPCNQGASIDEDYTACIIDVALHGDVASADLRPRVAASLALSPGLLARLSRARQVGGGRSVGVIGETPRLRRVFGKTGRGLWA